MWEHGGCSECIQQDAVSRCGYLDCHDIWTCECGEGHKAMELFQQMQEEKGVQPDSFTFVGALNACASLVALEEGRSIYQQIIQSGCESVTFVGNSLVDMYVKCGSMEDACKVFNKMTSRNVVSWNAMILGHVKCG